MKPQKNIEDMKISFTTFNQRNKKVKLKQLPPNYICKRCHKPGHFVQDCPENNNPLFDKKEAAGLPQEMFEEADDNDQNTYLMKNGKRVRIKDNAKQFRPTKREVALQDDDIPERVRCPHCRKLIVYASLLRCCGKTLCMDCVNASIAGERCVSCGKDIDVKKDIVPDKRMREELQNYFNKENKKILEAARRTSTKEEQTNEQDDTESSMEVETPTYPTIEKKDISVLFGQPKDCTEPVLAQREGLFKSEQFDRKLIITDIGEVSEQDKPSPVPQR